MNPRDDRCAAKLSKIEAKQLRILLDARKKIAKSEPGSQVYKMLSSLIEMAEAAVNRMRADRIDDLIMNGLAETPAAELMDALRSNIPDATDDELFAAVERCAKAHQAESAQCVRLITLMAENEFLARGGQHDA